MVGLALISPAASLGAAAAIYRCLDKKQAVLYTDEPCKDGQVIDVRAGEADPAALARLDRERDALSQSATQRIADERRNAAQRDLAATYARPAENNIDNYRRPTCHIATAWATGIRLSCQTVLGHGRRDRSCLHVSAHNHSPSFFRASYKHAAPR